MNKLLTEMIGAFFLVLVIAMTGDPLAIGVMLMIMVYMGGHVSGAHYNPAVTLGVWMRGLIGNMEAIHYVVAQVIGSFLAVVVASLLGSSFLPAMGAEVAMSTVLIAEIVFTFALVLVILNVATASTTKGNDYFGAAIGLTIFVAATAAGGISGGAFNPAVGLGPWLFDIIQGGGFSHIWLYLVGPLLGGALAAWVFGLMNPKEK